MPQIKWIKISTDILNDEKISIINTLPERDAILVIWFLILIVAGRSNRGGYLLLNEHLPYNDEMLAAVLQRPLNTVRLALETFVRLGMIEFVTSQDQNVIYITNFDAHQNLEGMEKIREQTRLRTQKYRQNLLPEVRHGDVTVTPKNKNKNIYTSKFENFWELYPRKVGKGQAQKAWMKQACNEEAVEKILEALETQKNSNYFSQDPKFIPHPATWLNGQRWFDELPESKAEDYIR